MEKQYPGQDVPHKPFDVDEGESDVFPPTDQAKNDEIVKNPRDKKPDPKQDPGADFDRKF